MNNKNSVNLSLNALQAAYASGELTPRILLQQLREQALQQSDYNAWIYILSTEELDNYLTALESKNRHELPLYGVPFAIKDNIDLAGIATTAACEDFRYIPKHSAPVVQHLLDAGAIPLGKTNLDQFATGLVGTRSPWGQGKNVFNKDYVSGGSSTGSAIATALGQVSFALGTDTAGSGRVPAAFNNLIGLKPSKGLLSTRGVVPACRSLDVVSIFTLCAEDAACVFDIAAQYDHKDAYARKNHYANRTRYFADKPVETFRFGVPKQLDFYGNAECEQLFNNAVSELKKLGGTAVELDFEPFIKAAQLLYEGPWVAERWLATQGVKLDSMLPVIQTIIGNGNKALATDAFSAQYKLAEYKRRCDELISELDFVVTPTTPTQFTRAGLDAEPIKYNSVLGTYTNSMNLLDYSACAVPVGVTSSGVHWGVTLFSQAFDDIKLVSYCAMLQNVFNLPMGATGFALPKTQHAGVNKPKAYIDVIVCGAHLKGQPLNWQLTERGAIFKECCQSAAAYKLYALADGKRPAMMRDEKHGKNIEIEIWSVPETAFGSFVAGIPAPLGIGKVETEDGRWLSGFICEASGLEGAKDISHFNSWRHWLENR